MINNLKKFFHTDKWWGKSIFMLLTYVIFWCVFYGSLFLIRDEFFELELVGKIKVDSSLGNKTTP